MKRFAWIVLTASAVALVGALAVIVGTQWQVRDEAMIESVGSRPSASVTHPAVAPSSPPTASVQTPGAESPSVPPDPATYPIPRRVRIPAIDVATRVVPVGLDPNGAIEVPQDIRLVGWYELGVPPGAPSGSAVLVAHRDGREQGRGVFYDLGRLGMGDVVLVRTDAGTDLAYTVVSRESILKRRLPYEELFAVDGPPRLTLLSCGGYYDADNGGYQDNVVVTAVPAGAASG